MHYQHGKVQQEHMYKRLDDKEPLEDRAFVRIYSTRINHNNDKDNNNKHDKFHLFFLLFTSLTTFLHAEKIKFYLNKEISETPSSLIFIHAFTLILLLLIIII